MANVRWPEGPGDHPNARAPAGRNLALGFAHVGNHQSGSGTLRLRPAQRGTGSGLLQYLAALGRCRTCSGGPQRVQKERSSPRKHRGLHCASRGSGNFACRPRRDRGHVRRLL